MLVKWATNCNFQYMGKIFCVEFQSCPFSCPPDLFQNLLTIYLFFPRLFCWYWSNYTMYDMGKQNKKNTTKRDPYVFEAAQYLLNREVKLATTSLYPCCCFGRIKKLFGTYIYTYICGTHTHIYIYVYICMHIHIPFFKTENKNMLD